jgi:hypothetical protein
MISRRSTLLAGLVTGVLLLGLRPLGLLYAAPGKNTIVIVTQTTNALFDLPLRELKRLYKAEQVTGPDGNALIPLNHAIGSPIRVAFESLVLKMSPDDVGRFWIDRKIRGQVGAPKSVPVMAVLRKAVATLPGTLTYLNASDLTPDLKVLLIDGKSPGAVDYPLQYE